MRDDYGPWMLHWPGAMPVKPDAVVICEMGFACSGDFIGPLPAEDFDWFCPGDPVARYRVQNPPRDGASTRDSVELAA